MNNINPVYWIMIGIIIVLILVIGFLWYGKSNFSANVQARNFSQSIDNDKVIIVSGWNEDELKKILDDFQKMYHNQGYPSYAINTTKQNESQYKLTFPNDIHPLLFIFLINYLAYPFNFDLKTHSIVVAGSTTLNADYQGLNQAFIGQKAVFYIPKNDSAHDVVYMVTKQGGSLSLNLTTGDWKDTDQANLNTLAKELQSEW